MSETKPTYSEFAESITGFEKQYVFTAFGRYLSELPAELVTNAWVYILKRREGMDNGTAKKAALSMSDKQISDLFADETDDDEPDAPDASISEVGKDDELGESEPETWLDSAS